MSGFDNGSSQSGVAQSAKQFGSILRGFGPPVPSFGVIGDLYLDTQTWFLYGKRTANGNTNPWGSYLFQVPAALQAQLKWFGTSPPDASVGINGDYFALWGGYPNYGLQPSVYGPMAGGVWPANPTNEVVVLNPQYTAEDEHEI